MWWIPLATTAASAVMGMYQGRQQQKAQSQARRDQALINMYAPLLGQQVQALPMQQDMVTPAAMSGAMTGLEMYQDWQMAQAKKNFYEKAAADSSNPTASAPTPIVSSFAGPVAPTAMSQGAPARNPYDYGDLRPIHNPDRYFGRGE